MLGLTLVCVGQLKEKYLCAACAEYLKRLGAYCKTTIIEIEESRATKGRTENTIKQEEGVRILSRVPPYGLVVTLEIEGRQTSSAGFADILAGAMTENGGHITFVIGGSFGLSPQVSSRADMAISFSKMTFPHQLMRVILLEQLYRGLNILQGGKYHK